MKDKGSFSPIVQRCVAEAVRKPKRSFSAPTEVCLEDWWLSKPGTGKGVSVSGIPIELRRCNYARREHHSAPTKKRYSLREFHSSEIVKRHGCTTVETSDGLIVSLCGFINRSRTCQNGFFSEVCRDFIYGFPFNWEYSAVQCGGDDSSESNDENISKCFLPAALDVYNGAQLHDLVLSLTDAERDMFNKKMYDNLMGVLNQERVDETNVQSSKFTPSSLADVNVQTPSNPSNKRQRNTLEADYTEQKVGVTCVSSSRFAEKLPQSTKMCSDGDSCDVGAMKEEKVMQDSVCSSRFQENFSDLIQIDSEGTLNKVEDKEGFEKELRPCQKSDTNVLTSRKRVCTSVTKLMKSGTEDDVNNLPTTPETAQKNILKEESTEEEGHVTVVETGNMIADQSEVRRLLEHLTSVGKHLTGQGRRLCKELKNLLY